MFKKNIFAKLVAKTELNTKFSLNFSNVSEATSQALNANPNCVQSVGAGISGKSVGLAETETGLLLTVNLRRK
jgi:hypothetical protein